MILIGDGFYERGCISAHYQSPCVEGDDVQAWAESASTGAKRARAGMQKKDGSPILSATLSLGPEHGETELDALIARLRPPEKLVILGDMSIGDRGAQTECVCTVQCVARPARIASSTVRPFNTGSTPGTPRQIGCTLAGCRMASRDPIRTLPTQPIATTIHRRPARWAV